MVMSTCPDCTLPNRLAVGRSSLIPGFRGTVEDPFGPGNRSSTCVFFQIVMYVAPGRRTEFKTAVYLPETMETDSDRSFSKPYGRENNECNTRSTSNVGATDTGKAMSDNIKVVSNISGLNTLWEFQKTNGPMFCKARRCTALQANPDSACDSP